MGTLFYPSGFDWTDADLNESLQLIVRNGQGLSRRNDWRSWKHMYGQIIHYKFNKMHLENRVNFQFMPTLMNACIHVIFQTSTVTLRK